MFYTYTHAKPDGTIFYIGKGKGKRAYDLVTRNAYWKNIVKKYGTPTVQILAEWKTEEESFSHEVLLIECFRSMGYVLANMTSGGEGISGYKHTKESLKKMSEANLGIKNANYGKPLSDARKMQLSFANSGPRSKEFKENRTGSKNPNFKGFIIATNILTKEQIIFDGDKALKAAGFTPPNVNACINKKPKYLTHKGHIFHREN
jgi:hypothetical protein